MTVLNSNNNNYNNNYNNNNYNSYYNYNNKNNKHMAVRGAWSFGHKASKLSNYNSSQFYSFTTIPSYTHTLKHDTPDHE